MVKKKRRGRTTTKGETEMNKKLKAWDSSKLDLDADYDSKTMQDWLAVLQGKKVPDAEPNNRAYAEAVRYGLKALQKRRANDE